MKYCLLAAIGVASLQTTLAGCPAPPPFHSPMSAEKTIQLNQVISTNLDKTDKQRGQVRRYPLVVNFWATWCAPCRKELPLLQALSISNTPHVYLINVGDSVEDSQRVLKALGITDLPTTYASSRVLADLSLRGLPATVVFSQADTAYLGMGKLTDDKGLRQWLDCLRSSL